MRWGSSLVLAAVMLAMLVLGIWLGGHPTKLPPFLREALVGRPVRLTAEATAAIEDNYYRSVPESTLSDASLRGMVRDLRRRYHDRFSDYFPPRLLQRFNEDISGRFSGIGTQIEAAPRGLRAVKVFKGSPAARAGIAVGDLIVSVDGRSLAGVGVDRARSMIVGPIGTAVTLGVVRPPGHRVRRLRVTRAEITTPETATRVVRRGGRTLGYVRYDSFTEGSHRDLAEAVQRVERHGAQGIVLDLRGNGGGLLEEAVADASIFLPKGQVVVSTASRTQGRAVYRTVGGNLPPRPLVVLIDGDTASAAEILTAALADDSHATVVGSRSFGKGVFQQEVDLSNGGALKLTVGEYFTPAGINLAGRGIRPDVAARDLPATQRDEALERALQVLASRLGRG